MAWSTPMTAVANTGLTAAQWNASVRDNLLETAPAKASDVGSYFVTENANSIGERVIGFASINTSETTGSTGYTDLATVGPVVTSTTGSRAVVMHTSRMENNTAGQYSSCSVDITGATTFAADDLYSLRFSSSTNNASIQATHVMVHSLTPGSNIFTMKYRCSGNTSTFVARRLTVMPY